MGRLAASGAWLALAALGTSSALDLWGRLEVERAAASGDSDLARKGKALLPFDAYARETVAAFEDPASAASNDLVLEGLSRRPRGAGLLRRAATRVSASGNEELAQALYVRAVDAARDSTAFAVAVGRERLSRARSRAAAAQAATVRRERLRADGKGEDAEKEGRWASEEVAAARRILAGLPALREALADDADGYTAMDELVAEAQRLELDLRHVAEAE